MGPPSSLGVGTMRFSQRLSRQRLAVSAFSVASLLGVGCGGRSQPLVLLVTIDTLRADRLGCYGSAGVRTPELDRLAREGALFADCSAVVPSTSPSHATLLTGLYPVSHGLRENGAPLREDVPLLPEAFRDAGYGTVAFISGFPLVGRFGFSRGFDRYDDRLTDGFTTHDGRTEGTERIATKTVDAFLRWLDESREPFFAWVHLFDPHSVYAAPPPFRRMYYEGHGERDPSNRSLDGVDLPAYLMLGGVTDVRFPIALYEGEVSYTDHELGRLIDALRARGVLDRTILVIVADHGESMTEHEYYFGHSHFLYEPSLHVPLIVRHPATVPAGLVVTDPVSLVDIYGTILDLAGVAPEPGAGDGRNLVPLLTGGAVSPELTLLERPPIALGTLYGARRGRWKYLVFGEGVERLYDVVNDPGETSNRLGDETATAASLREEVLRRLGAAPGERPEIDDDTRARLRGLGYVDD